MSLHISHLFAYFEIFGLCCLFHNKKVCRLITIREFAQRVHEFTAAVIAEIEANLEGMANEVTLAK